MDLVYTLFNRLDDWRQEWCAVYLAEALENRYGIHANPLIVPEFPVRIGTIREDIPINKSFKIDYLAISKAKDTAFLVELKTDVGSRREKQDWYLSAASEAGLPKLISGLLEIFRATIEKRKYFQLLLLLEKLDLISIPDEMKALMQGNSLVGVNELTRKVKITCAEIKCKTVYVQPTGDQGDVIAFAQFREVVLKHSDPLSLRLAESLRKWCERAGVVGAA